ncbi:MAG: DUF4304 domain-containing protein [Gammaproteobacteria bacterium]
MASDFISREITSQLKPVLVEDGFFRRGPKFFVRVRGDLVDVVSFQVSQYGSKLFYVHYFCNLLPNPDWKRATSGYRVGNRLNGGQVSGTNWIGDTEANAQDAMQDVVGAYEATIRPWFEQIPDVRNWIVEYVCAETTPLQSLDMAIALCLIGKKGRAWWITCDLVDGARKGKEKEFFNSFQEAIDDGSYKSLLRQWRQEAIEKNSIGKAVT